MSMNLTRLDMTTKDDLTEDLIPQEGDTADTNEHDTIRRSKTKHTQHGNTRVFKVKQETWRDADMTHMTGWTGNMTHNKER